MADIINEFIAEQAFTDAERFGKDLDALLAKFVELAGGVKAFEKALKNSGGDAPEKVKKYNAALTEMEKTTRSAVVAEHKRIVTLTKANKILQERRVEINANNKAIRENKQLVDAERGSINRATQLIKKWTKEQENLNVTTKRGQLINQAYIKAIDKARAFTNKYGNSLRKQRDNIGNYASGNLELIQVLREFPSLANSVQTFMMAISNNLPQLIQRVRTTAVEMGSWRKAMSKVASGLFSFGGIVALATTALTFLVPLISKAASKTNIFKKSAEGAKKSQELLNKAWEDESVKTAIKNVTDLNVKVEEAKKGLVKKEQVVKLYNTTIGKTAGLVKNLDQVEQALTNHGDAYIQMTLKKAAANLALEDAAKKSLEAERARQTAEVNSLDDFKAFSKFLSAGAIAKISAGLLDAQTIKEIGAARELQRQLNIKGLENDAKKEIDLYKSLSAQASKIAKDNNFNIFGDNKDPKKKKDKKAIGPIRIPSDNSNIEAEAKALANRYRNVFAEFMDKLATDPENKKKAAEAIEKLMTGGELSDDEASKLAAELQVTVKVNANSKKKAKEDIAKFLKELQSLKKVADQFLSDAGDIGELIFQKQMLRISEEKSAIEDKYNREAALIKSNFTTIEERDKALGVLEAKREAERENIRKKELAAKQRQARFQRDLDVAKILSQTSLAIMGFLNDPGGKEGTRLSILAGIKGASELAKVLAIPIPQYKHGTKDHPGGDAIVGDGGKREVAVLPSGETFLTPDKPTFLDLPKHSKVFPDLKSYLYQAPKIPKWNSTSSNTIVDFQETNTKLDNLTNVLKKKNLGVTVRGDGSYTVTRNSRIF